MGLRIEIDGATVEVAPRAALRERYGIVEDGPPFALARIAVADIAQTGRVLDAGRVPWRNVGASLAVDAMGAALLFEPRISL